MSDLSEEYALIQEVLHCRDCHVWDPENQPSVLRQLQQDPHCYDNRVIACLPNGMSLSLPMGGSVPLHTDFVLCDKHAERAPNHWKGR